MLVVEIFDADAGVIECHDVVEMAGLALAGINNIFSLSILDMDVYQLIMEFNNGIVKVKQLYKNKATLVSVMDNYAIKYRFDFRAKTSDKQRYVFRLIHMNQIKLR